MKVATIHFTVATPWLFKNFFPSEIILLIFPLVLKLVGWPGSTAKWPLSVLYNLYSECINKSSMSLLSFHSGNLTKASINPTAELHKACLCYCKNISKSYSIVFKENNTLEKNGNLSSYRDPVSLCLNRHFPLAREGREWASRKEWGRSSCTFKQCFFSSYQAQSKNWHFFIKLYLPVKYNLQKFFVFV